MTELPDYRHALYLLLIFAVLSVALALQRARESTLWSVPGPFLNRISVWPLKLATIQGRRIYWVHALHQQYGPFVVLSPEEASVSDVAAVKEIHRIGGGFLKAPWYSKFTGETGPETEIGIFAVRDPKLHAARRKLFSAAFSRASLATYEDVIATKAQLTVAGIKRSIAKDGVTDILSWFTFMANDVIATLSVGDSFKALEAGHKTQFIRDIETVMKMDGMAMELPILRLPLSFFSPKARLQQAGAAAIQKARDMEKLGLSHHSNIFSKILAEEGGTLTKTQIETEASMFIVAGSDTTAVTLTYLCYAVLSSADVKSKVLAECRSLPDEFSLEEALALPYLRIVMQETLRLYCAAPGALQRSVPIGGRRLGSYVLADDVVVSTQAYTLHRDPEVYVDPLQFRPERWQNPTSQMKDAFMPWGGGTRVCIGIHLAEMEMAYAAALFFKSLPDARLSIETTPESMTFENYFLIAPKSHRCLITGKSV